MFLNSSGVNRRTSFRETDKKQHVTACRARFFSSKTNIPIRTKNEKNLFKFHKCIYIIYLILERKKNLQLLQILI